MKVSLWDKLAVVSIAVGAPLMILALLAIIISDASRSYQPQEQTCLCLDGEPAFVTATSTANYSTTVPVTRFVEVTRSVVVTRHVAITIPRDAVTSELEIMFAGEEVGRVSDEDLEEIEEYGGCYVTDMFPAKLGRLYYHIYVCVMSDPATEEGR